MRVRKFITLALFAITLPFTACDDDNSGVALPEKESSDIIQSGDLSSDSEPAEEISSSLESETTISSSCLKSESSSSESSSSESLKSSGSQKIESSSSNDASEATDVSSSSRASQVKPKVEYGELIDSRDGKAYKTVKIGEQVWMAENLNFETVDSYCYKEDSTKCSSYYGRYYTWAAALNACPESFHLPTCDEWKAMYTSLEDSLHRVRVTVLQAEYGWALLPSDRTLVNSTGFSAVSAGYRDIDGNFLLNGDFAGFWSASEFDSDSAYFTEMYYNVGLQVYFSKSSKDYGFSIRCLKDEP